LALKSGPAGPVLFEISLTTIRSPKEAQRNIQ
jgi:hypothetical protein